MNKRRSAEQPTRRAQPIRPSPQARIVFWISTINGLCSVFFGGLMMLFPVNTPLGLGALLGAMGKFPFQDLFFQDLFWSGAALVLCNGSVSLFSAATYLKKADSFATLSLIAGCLLVAWCVLESIYLPNPAAVFYGCVGVFQIVLSMQISRSSDDTKV